jgi:hypothetical protein
MFPSSLTTTRQPFIRLNYQGTTQLLIMIVPTSATHGVSLLLMTPFSLKSVRSWFAEIYMKGYTWQLFLRSEILYKVRSLQVQ